MFKAGGGIEEVVCARAEMAVRTKRRCHNGLVTETSDVFGSFSVRYESERIDDAGACNGVDPAGDIGSIEHFAPPQQFEFLGDCSRVKPVDDAATGTAAVQAEHQSRPLR